MWVYVIHIVFLGVLLSWYANRYVDISDKRYFIFGISTKVFSALFFWFMFQTYFGSKADTFSYFKASLVWRDLFIENPQQYLSQLFSSSESISGIFSRQPRAVFFTKVVSVFSILTNGSYFLNTIYFSLIAFSASWFLFCRLSVFSKRKRNVWWVILFVFPGILFWASGITKETIVVAGLYGLTGVFLGYHNLQKRNLMIELLVAIITLFLLIKIKYYVAAVFVPLLIFAFYGLMIRRIEVLKNSFLKYLIPVFLVVTAVLFIINLSPNFEPGNLLNRIVIDHNRLLSRSYDEDFRINFIDYSPDLISFLKNSPLALFSGFYRPMIWEGSDVIHIIAGFQNAVLLIISCLALIQLSISRKKPSFEAILTLLYCLTMAAFLAFSTPNFGTLERYKVLYQPFLLIAMSDYLEQLFYKGKFLLRPALKSKNQGNIVRNQ